MLHVLLWSDRANTEECLILRLTQCLSSHWQAEDSGANGQGATDSTIKITSAKLQ